MATNEMPEMSREELIEHNLMGEIQGALDDLEDARTRLELYLDASTLAMMARARAKLDVLLVARGMINDDDKTVREAIGWVVERLTDSLLMNRHRPTSTCPFSNAIELETADVHSHMREAWVAALGYLEKST